MTASKLLKQLNIARVLQEINNFYTNQTDTFDYPQSISDMQDYLIRTQYSNDGKENLRSSIQFHLGKNSPHAAAIYSDVIQVLQPNKVIDVICLGRNSARTNDFEMTVGPVVLYVDKTSFL